MKIGVLSDTHGSLVQTKKALDALGKCDLYIHLGDVLYHGPRNPLFKSYNPQELGIFLRDKEITYIKGNCDSDVDCMYTGKDISKKERFFNLGKLKIYAVHGYEESLEERIERARKLGANVLLFGHSHIKMLKEVKGLVIVNPGSTSLPKDGSPSCALYENGKWKLIQLSEDYK